MPKSWENDNSLSEGLNTLSQTFQELARQKQNEEQQDILRMQNQNAHINAFAQLITSIGSFAGEPEINNDVLQKETGGMLSVKKDSVGSKAADRQVKVDEGTAKRAFAQQQQAEKFNQQMTLENAKWMHSMSKIEEAAKSGDKLATFRAIQDHLKTFGVTGGAEDVAAAERSVGVGKEATANIESGNSETKKPLANPVGKSGGLFGIGGKEVTHKDVIAALGSEEMANSAEQQYEQVKKNIENKVASKSGRTWDELFFEKYPALKGKISF
jgi:hypothetical protein